MGRLLARWGGGGGWATSSYGGGVGFWLDGDDDAWPPVKTFNNPAGCTQPL